MRILLTKLSNDKHELTIVRRDRSRETIELVTRETLFHDLLHHSVESVLPTQHGFWGTLASGKTFADMNDRTGESTRENTETLYLVEGIVGVMTGVTAMPAADAFEKLSWYSETQGQPLAKWCTLEFVEDVLERMRQALGRWKATPFGNTMEIIWDEQDS
jgi:hypothetical protein